MGVEQLRISAFKNELEKIALNAIGKRIVAKSKGLIFEGSGRNWALRNLRHGKSWDEIGSVSNNHLNAAKKNIDKYSPRGREVSFDVYKSKRTPISIGGLGNAPAPNIMSNKIIKTFHTHPYSGIIKQDPDKILKSILRAMNPDKMTRKEVDEMHSGMMSIPAYKKSIDVMRERIKKSRANPYTKTQKAHPDPEKLSLIGQATDLNFMEAMPRSHHNILNPDDKVLGIHKVRPQGLREVYRQL